MKNLPERIYLNLGDGCFDDADFRDLSEVTWSEEKVNDTDVEYVRKSQWISVDERLPEPDTMCLVFGYQDFVDGNITRYTMMAWYDGEDFTDAYDDRKYRPEKWMAIPLVPIQLNPEKEER